MKISYIIPQKEVDSQNYYWYQNSFTDSELGSLESSLQKLSFEKATTVGGGDETIQIGRAHV